MSYYLRVNYTDPNRQIAVDVPTPTNSGGYNFEIEFECQITASELVLMGPNVASTGNIAFLRSSSLEYRNSGNSNINMTHGVNVADWHVYRMVFTGSGAGNIAFYVDGVFKSNYIPTSSIVTQAFTSLLHVGGSSGRRGNFRYWKFTDFNNAASNRMYDARAHVPGDETTGLIRETANGVNGTAFSGWIAAPMEFVSDGPAPSSYNSTVSASVPLFGVSAAQSSTAPQYSATIAAGVPLFGASVSQQSTAPGYGSALSFGVPLFAVAASQQQELAEGSASVSFSVPLFSVSSGQISTVPVYSSQLSVGVPLFTVNSSQQGSLPSGGSAVSFGVPLFSVSAAQSSTAPGYSASLSFGVPLFGFSAFSGEFDHYAGLSSRLDAAYLSSRIDAAGQSSRIDL